MAVPPVGFEPTIQRLKGAGDDRFTTEARAIERDRLARRFQLVGGVRIELTGIPKEKCFTGTIASLGCSHRIVRRAIRPFLQKPPPECKKGHLVSRAALVVALDRCSTTSRPGSSRARHCRACGPATWSGWRPNRTVVLPNRRTRESQRSDRPPGNSLSSSVANALWNYRAGKTTPSQQIILTVLIVRALIVFPRCFPAISSGRRAGGSTAERYGRSSAAPAGGRRDAACASAAP
jgi:hypothetical protein